MPHRQLLDFATKGNFIDSDPNTGYELIEGIVGTPPFQKGSNYTQEGIQILEKLGDMAIKIKLDDLINLAGLKKSAQGVIDSMAKLGELSVEAMKKSLNIKRVYLEAIE